MTFSERLGEATMIRTATQEDAAPIAEIYNHYIEHTVVTFEESRVSGDEIGARIIETLEAKLPWLVAEDEQGRVLGYAYASKWKGRCAYRYSVEITVYLAQQATGKGLGRQLYKVLFEQLKQLSYHTVIGGISLPNPASVALHEKCGLEKVAHFKEVGFKFGQWVDVGYWQGQL